MAVNIFLFFILIVLSPTIFAQHLNSPLKSIHDKREFIIGLDNRITRINDRIGLIYGIYSGLAYGDNLRVKLSLSGTPFRLGKHEPDEISRTSRLLFMSVGQEFDFLTFNRFKVTAYANVGFGYIFIESSLWNHT